jgi:hypothetical protein
MPFPFPPWIVYAVVGATGIVVLVALGLFLPWAWAKLFNYLGRHEVEYQRKAQQLDSSDDG